MNSSFDLPHPLSILPVKWQCWPVKEVSKKSKTLLVVAPLLRVSQTMKIAFLSETRLEWFVLHCYSHPVSGSVCVIFFKVTKTTQGDNKIPSSLLKSEIP